MRHLLVTNDFPPKVGGIQNYLWELWSRLDPETFSVLTATSDPNAAIFDQEQAEVGITIDRVPGRIRFFPSPKARRAVESTLADRNASMVVLEPAFPLGHLATSLRVPSVQVLHGAEETNPGRLPVSRHALAAALRSSSGVIAAGTYPEREARRATGGSLPPVLQIPPGVDAKRFRPLDAQARRAIRSRLDLPVNGPLVVSVSRLVPRKGMDTLIDAAAMLQTDIADLTVAIGGTGRDADRLERRVSKTGAPVKMLGRVSDDDLPGLVAAADVFVMACRSRWGGLEQEGFGIVFVEAAAAGVPQIAGRSGGADDAVIDGETGVLLDHPEDPRELRDALRSLLADEPRRRAMGDAGRSRAVASFDYDALAHRLGNAFAEGWPLG